MSALTQQIGGSHYQKYKISPLAFAEKLGLSPTIFCAYKYVVRYKDKGGKTDLEKALHCGECFLEIGQVKILDLNYDEIDKFIAQFDLDHAVLIRSVLMLQMDKRNFKLFERFVKQAMKEFE